MKAFETTIKRIENEQVTKTIQVDDPVTKEKKTVEYQTYEWVEKAEKVVKIPNTPNNLKVLSDIASTVGFDITTKRPDSNIRYTVEAEAVTDNSMQSGDVELWFVCGSCNSIEFDCTATKETSGNLTAYKCSGCGTKLAEVISSVESPPSP